MATFALRPNQKIVFIGDSITDCGRRNDASAPYGSGYVSMVRNFLTARYPELNLTIVNVGISGNTIRNLKVRWQADVIDQQPDVLSVMIGINDVWRFVTGRDADGVPLDEYKQTYRELLQATTARTRAQLVLADPFLIETDAADPFRARLDPYIAYVHELCREFGAVSVPVQEAFYEGLRRQRAPFWANDRVHPFAHGHALIAISFLRAFGFTL